MYQHPRLDHESTAFIAAQNAEQELLRTYGLTAKETWLTLNYQQLRLQIIEIGEGTPILVIPGNTGDSFPFLPLIPQLPGYRFILVNRPGGGLSDGFDHEQVAIKPFVNEMFSEVLAALGLEKVNIMAHSMGCHWSIWSTQAHPERVNKLTLIGNPGRVMLAKSPLPLRMALVPGIGNLAIKALVPKDPQHALNGLKKMGTDSAALAQMPSSFAQLSNVHTDLAEDLQSQKRK